MIREIDNNSVGPMLPIIIGELEKLKVHETHILYRAGEENRKVMDDLDKSARVLLAEVHKIRTELNNTLEEINKIYPSLEELREERTKREGAKLGFAP